MKGKIILLGLVLIVSILGIMYSGNFLLQSTHEPVLPYGTSYENVVCQKMKESSRFTECRYTLGDGAVRLCQDFGDRKFNETNSSVHFSYCEDYRFQRDDSNITILRVR